MAELFKLADYYGEEDLKRRCEQQLGILITEKNASVAYTVSTSYNAKVTRQLLFRNLLPTVHACGTACNAQPLNLFSILVQTLYDIVLDFIIPKFNNVVKTEGYKSMPDELQQRLIQDMAAENVFEGLKRKSS